VEVGGQQMVLLGPMGLLVKEDEGLDIASNDFGMQFEYSLSVDAAWKTREACKSKLQNLH
jgi:hypothetical protein